MEGSLWTIGGFALGQVIRFGTNLFLAWSLFPEAFGLMAIVHTVIAGLAMFSDLGTGPSIVRSRRGDDPKFLNVAWTIQIGRGLLLSLTACLIAFPIATLYGDERLSLLLCAAGLAPFINGFDSTATHRLARQVVIHRIVGLELASQTAAALVMIGWVALSPSIWALVAGGLISSVLRLALSHRLLSDHRHRLTWEAEAASEVLAFGRWIVVSSSIGFLASQADYLLLGQLVSMASLGVFSIAANLSMLPWQVVSRLGNSVMFPVFSDRLGTNDLVRFFLKTRRTIVLAGGALVACLAASAVSLVEALYDDRYHEAGWALRVLCLATWLRILTVPSQSVLLALGKPRQIAVANAWKLALMLPMTLTGFSALGFPGAVAGLAASELARYAIFEWSIRRVGLGSFVTTDAMHSALLLLAVLSGAVSWKDPLEVGSLTDAITSAAMAGGIWAVIAALPLLQRLRHPESAPVPPLSRLNDDPVHHT